VRTDNSFVGVDGKPVMGFGEVVLNDTKNVRRKINIEYSLNAGLLFLSLLLWSVLLFLFKKAETAEPDYANVH